jgi:hypothetical protein
LQAGHYNLIKSYFKEFRWIGSLCKKLASGKKVAGDSLQGTRKDTNLQSSEEIEVRNTRTSPTSFCKQVIITSIKHIQKSLDGSEVYVKS